MAAYTVTCALCTDGDAYKRRTGRNPKTGVQELKPSAAQQAPE